VKIPGGYTIGSEPAREISTSRVINAPRDLVFAFREFRKRHLFAVTNAIDEREVRRSQQAEILAVLLVDALDIFGDHQLDAGAKLGIRRLLTAGTFAAPLTADRRYKAAFLHVTTLDRHFVPALQARVRELAQGFIKEEADVRRGDLVSGDVITQFGIVLRIFGVPGQVFTRELETDQLRIFR